MNVPESVLNKRNVKRPHEDQGCQAHTGTRALGLNSNRLGAAEGLVCVDCATSCKPLVCAAQTHSGRGTRAGTRRGRSWRCTPEASCT